MKNICMTIALFSSVFLQAGCDRGCIMPDSACVTPTEYVLQFLVRSGTLYRGSHEWLSGLFNDKTVRTNYLATRDSKVFEYVGSTVFLHDLLCKTAQVPVDTVKAKFEVVRIGDNVKITSHIEDIEVRSISGQEEIMAEFPTLDSEVVHQKDGRTTCTYERNVSFETKDKAHITLSANCETLVAFDEFMNIFNVVKKDITR